MSKYETCHNMFSIQVHEIVRINELEQDLGDLYQNKIGTLYDEFNIEIPLRFDDEYAWLWSDGTIKTVKEAAGKAASILAAVRVKPKPYEPLSVEDVRRQLLAIKKAMVSDMAEQFLECACPVFYDKGW